MDGRVVANISAKQVTNAISMVRPFKDRWNMGNLVLRYCAGVSVAVMHAEQSPKMWSCNFSVYQKSTATSLSKSDLEQSKLQSIAWMLQNLQFRNSDTEYLTGQNMRPKWRFGVRGLWNWIWNISTDSANIFLIWSSKRIKQFRLAKSWQNRKKPHTYQPCDRAHGRDRTGYSFRKFHIRRRWYHAHGKSNGVSNTITTSVLKSLAAWKIGNAKTCVVATNEIWMVRIRKNKQKPIGLQGGCICIIIALLIFWI